MNKKTSSVNKFTARLIFTMIFSGIVCAPVYASSLTSSDGFHVDGFSLPGLRPAGYPNFENAVKVRWNNNGKNNAMLHATYKGGGDFFFNYSPTDSYVIKDGSYHLKARFDSFGGLLGGSIKITGVIGNEGDSLYANGVLMTAQLDDFSYTDNLIGFNTTGIVCPWFDFCTTDESVYLSLDNGEFSTDLKKYKSDALAVTTVPVPAAVWLFGSGLIGLVGVARRRRTLPAKRLNTADN